MSDYEVTYWLTVSFAFVWFVAGVATGEAWMKATGGAHLAAMLVLSGLYPDG